MHVWSFQVSPALFSQTVPNLAVVGEETLEATLLIVGAGVRPRQELAEMSGLELGGRGGIKAWMPSGLGEVWVKESAVKSEEKW